MHYLLKLSSSANPDLNFWVSKLSKNSGVGVQMMRWTHRWLSPWCMRVCLRAQGGLRVANVIRSIFLLLYHPYNPFLQQLGPIIGVNGKCHYHSARYGKLG